jgi:sialic acid synthase SpsE
MNKIISIGNFKIGDGNRPFIIAEMACAHDGVKNKAIKLIDASVEAKADAVQLQFFVADETVTPFHPAYEVVKRIEFSESDWTDIFRYAKSKNILVFVCTYDVPSVKLAKKLNADGIKLNSADLSNPEVVIEVAKTKIPFTLGTGASTIDEITKGLNLAIENGAKDIILMHGVQNFPTQTQDLNISKVSFLKEHFPIPVGYHDHTDGDDEFTHAVDLIAIGLGANVIEKHITMDRKEKGIDYQAALEPEEFKKFVERIHRAFIAFGSSEVKPFTESELKYRKFQKKSVVAAIDLKAGEIISREKVNFIRNENPGLPPSDFSLINGKKLIRDVQKYHNIMTEDINK